MFRLPTAAIFKNFRPYDESYETYIARVNANKTCLITYVVSEEFTSREMLAGLIIMAHINNMNLSLCIRIYYLFISKSCMLSEGARKYDIYRRMTV